MANSWFQFKQFRVEQSRCAMKVCTDSCLFGAWAPLPDSGTVLDIGTGTGLLALMAAQRQPGITIEAIELEESAAEQARENANSSPWADRIQVFQGRLQEFRPDHPYAAILCNPPFFPKSLHSSDEAEKQAKHHLTLRFEDIIDFAKAHLAPEGALNILLPPPEQAQFQAIAHSSGFFPQQELLVRDRPYSPVFRTMTSYQKSNHQTESRELSIKDEAGDYSNAFRALLRDFYLAF